jgi:anti-sigma regulatory factor (Ser/Thr protein kinase)
MTGGTGAVSAPSPTRSPTEEPAPDSGVGTACQIWLHISALEFAALPSAVPCARLHTRQVVGEWGLEPLADDAEILASELLGNAIKASWSLSGAGLVALRLLASRQRLLIEIWDQNPDDPRPRLADHESVPASWLSGPNC